MFAPGLPVLLLAYIFQFVLWSGYTQAFAAEPYAHSEIRNIQYDETDAMDASGGPPPSGPDEIDAELYREYPVSEAEPPADMTDPYATEPLPDAQDPEYYQDGELPADSGQGWDLSSDPGPLVDEPYPLVDQQEPLVDRPEPMVLQPAPLVEQPHPLVDQNPPLVERPGPLVEQPAPLVRQPRPLVNQPAPLVRQPSPLVNQPVPLVRQSSPLVSRPAPLVR